MSNPFAIPLTTSPGEIYADMVTRVQQTIGDNTWRPQGILEQVFRVHAAASAEHREAFNSSLQAGVVAQVSVLNGIPQQLGLPAGSTITVKAIDSTGHTLPAESRVWLGDIEAQTVDELVIAGGDDEGTVAIQCVQPGTSPNGATGDVQIDPLDWIDTVELDAPFSGGVDPELFDEFGTRLAEEVQLRTDAVSLPPDAAVIARRNQAVGWAYVVDHYDSTTDTSGLPLTFSVVVAKADGTAVGSGALAEVDADLQARREVNYVIRVSNPTYSPVDFACQVVPRPGFTGAQAVAGAIAAVTLATSPGVFLTPQFNMQPNYVPPSRIYSTDLVAAAKSADAVLHVIPSSVEIGDGSTDYIDLASPIDLPTTGTIAITAAP